MSVNAIAKTHNGSTQVVDLEYARMEALADRALEMAAAYREAMDTLKEYVARTGREVTAKDQVFDFGPVVSYEFSMHQLIPVLRRHRVHLADVATISKPVMDRLLSCGGLGDRLRPLVAEKVGQRFDHRKAGHKAQ